MIRLDRKKSKTSKNNLIDFKKSRFTNVMKCDPITGTITEDYFELRKDFKSDSFFGISNLRIDNLKNEIIFEISSKILREQYLSLINVSTIGRALENLNSSGIIKIDIPSTIDNSVVLSVDITQDLRLKNEVSSYLRDFRIFASLTNYRAKKYCGGIEFYSHYPSNKTRLKLYCKMDEIISRKSCNQEILKYIPIEKFDKLLRVECSLTQHKAIRKFFNFSESEPLNLNQILNCKEPVLLNCFNDFIPKIDFKIVGEDFWEDSPSYTDLIKTIGEIELLRICGYDLEAVTSIMKSKVSGNVSYYRKKAKKSLMMALKLKSKSEFKSLAEIRKLLED